jgi:hypothetical protein
MQQIENFKKASERRSGAGKLSQIDLFSDCLDIVLASPA